MPKDTGFMLHNRGGLFTLQPNAPNTLAPRKRPLHTIIPAFMEKDGVRIGFGIMGGWNQAQAHAQFVANIADYGMTIQQALEAGRFTKKTFDGCDVDIEAVIPAATRSALTALGHKIELVRTALVDVRLRPGGDDRQERRPLRRLRAAPRRRRDSGSAADFQRARAFRTHQWLSIQSIVIRPRIKRSRINRSRINRSRKNNRSAPNRAARSTGCACSNSVRCSPVPLPAACSRGLAPT